MKISVLRFTFSDLQWQTRTPSFFLRTEKREGTQWSQICSKSRWTFESQGHRRSFRSVSSHFRAMLTSQSLNHSRCPISNFDMWPFHYLECLVFFSSPHFILPLSTRPLFSQQWAGKSHRCSQIVQVSGEGIAGHKALNGGDDMLHQWKRSKAATWLEGIAALYVHISQFREWGSFHLKPPAAPSELKEELMDIVTMNTSEKPLVWLKH